MKVVSYIRVSTRKQGESGLGLEAQQHAVAAYVKQHDAVVLAEYREVESGARNDRPQLLRAIAHAKRARARLVIARLDRLGRNVAFVASLMESGCDFVCCDNPHASKLTAHILIAVAEEERRLISARTRDALAAAKRRGVLLGSSRPGHWEGREDARRRGAVRASKAAAVAHRKAAEEAFADLVPMVRSLAERMTIRQIAEHLNDAGETTRRGKPWGASQVFRLLQRAGDESA